MGELSKGELSIRQEGRCLYNGLRVGCQPKVPTVGNVNLPFMHFSITNFLGFRLSDVRRHVGLALP